MASDDWLALPSSLHINRRLSTWLRIDRAGYAEVYSGKVELGQGILNALAQIAAEELDLDIGRIRMVPALTGTSPDEAMTSGSLSVQQSGAALRHVCAQARGIYLAVAAATRGLKVSALRVADGIVLDGDRPVCSYWDMAEPGLLEVDAHLDVRYKRAEDYRVVGRSLPREDVAQKVFGEFVFIHDMVLPGMLHGRIIRPPSPDADLLEWHTADVRAWDGVAAVLEDGSLLGVVAETEALSERAAARLAEMSIWSELDSLPDEAALPAWLRGLPASTLEIAPPPHARRTAASPAVRTMHASYSKPFIRHASIGPSCALALYDEDGQLHVWTHSQGIYNLRKDLALAFDMPVHDIVIQHVQGAGCYGHNGADDVAFDAAWLARGCPGRPVRVQWSRQDELCWSPLGPAMAIDLEADVDEVGGVVAWRHRSFSPGHGLRPGRGETPTLLGTWYLSTPFQRIDAMDASRSAGGGGDRNADPLYAFPTFSVVCRRVLDIPMRTSALRALGAFGNVFAIESFMDELALAAGRDPIDYRIAHLADERAIGVLRAAAAQAGWQSRTAPAGEGKGRGIGFARYKNTGAYCAVAAEVDVAERVRVRKLHIAVDVGLAINPDGVCQQIEGGALQATSWALMEAAHFDRMRMLDHGWDRYPILRFPDVPQVEVNLLPGGGHASAGAGEASLGPTGAAIANAVFDALGVRVRDLPLTHERIVRAMAWKAEAGLFISNGNSMNLNIFSGGAAKAVVTGLQPDFEKANGCTLVPAFSAVGAMRDRLLAGEACDVVILTSSLIEQLAAQGHVAAGSVRPLGRVATGIAVPEGAPVPAIGTRQELKAALATAAGLYVPDLRKSTAGIHIAGVLKALGLDEALAGRIHEHPNGAVAMHALAQAAQGAIGCTQVTEIMYTPGIRLVGELPAEHGLNTVYAAAVCTRAQDAALAARLVEVLSNEASAGLRRRCGFGV